MSSLYDEFITKAITNPEWEALRNELSPDVFQSFVGG